MIDLTYVFVMWNQIVSRVSLKYLAAVSLAFGQFILQQDKPASPYIPLLKAIILLHKDIFMNSSKHTHTQT